MEAAYLETICRLYPNAVSTRESVDKLLEILRSQLDLPPDKVMLADSICSDDLNSMEYPPNAAQMLGPFKMGGLNGFPFTGLTGVGAFASHAPEKGALLVFYAPHIGIAHDGSAGHVLREGQSVPTSCCGAAKAALAKLDAGKIIEGDLSDLDYQQNTIEQIFLRSRDRILGSSGGIVTATEVMYEAIERRIDILVERTKFDCPHLILVGGVLINTDPGVGSYVSVRRLRYVDITTKSHHDWAPLFI